MGGGNVVQTISFGLRPNQNSELRGTLVHAKAIAKAYISMNVVRAGTLG